MSMIHGIVGFDGRPPDREATRAMLAAGAAACPDGAEAWHGGNATLGLGLLRTLPEPRTAPGPVRAPDSGLVIVADARIDNRPELWRKLGLRDGGMLSDAELILRAYRAWGEDCAERLIGDFAFAIWDENERKLHCARDAFGVTPLYYARLPGGLMFSNYLPSLLAPGKVSRDLDEYSIADMLAGLPLAHDQTLYRDISLLPPAHCLTVGEQGMTLREYWRPQIGEPIRYARDEEYVEAYRGLLQEAIACRLETNGNVAGLLSGGLDSGSIAAIASEMQSNRGGVYATYSFVLAEGQQAHERDESELIELVHGMRGITGHFITTQDFQGHPSDLYAQLKEHAFLVTGPHLAVLLKELGETGTRVLLDGYGGDQCPTCGFDIPLQEFLDGQHFAGLAQYITASSGFHGRSRPRRLLGMLRNHFHTGGPMNADELVSERSALSREFRERIGIRERASQNWLFHPVKRGTLGELMVHGLQDRKGLQHYPLFAGNRVERRFPFLDRRLVEFCLSVPSVQHNFDMNRRLIRRAMHGVLPDAIRLRKDKSGNNAPGALSFLHKNRDYYIAAIDAASNDERIIAYLDLAKLRKRFAQALPAKFSGANGIDFMPGATLRTFNMMRFLQQHFVADNGRTPAATEK